MAPSARRALRLIRTCIEEDRIIVTVHFSRRMDQRGMVWPDVLTAIDAPDDVRWGGGDESGRPKWHIAGRAADGLDIELVCVLDEDESDRMVVFVTLYWEQP